MRGVTFLLTIALFSVPLLSGCFGGNDASGDEETTPPVTTTPPSGVDSTGATALYGGDLPIFAQRAVSNSDRTAGEPTVAVNINGVVLYPSIDFDSVAAGNPLTRVYRSLDQGVTWDDVSPKLPSGHDTQVLTMDPYVYSDPVTGRLFTMDLNLAYGGIISWSDDDGSTWTTNPSCCGIPGPNDHQTLFSGPSTVIPGSPLYGDGGRITYFCVNQVYDAICSRSLDGGLTWSAGSPAYYEPVAPGDPGAGGPAVCGSLHGHGHASEATGTVFLGKGHCGLPLVSRSEDNGLTWTEVTINRTIGAPDHEVSISSDSAGNVYAFWLDRNGYPRLAVSTDDGQNFGPAFNATSPGVTAAKFPSIVAGDDGRVAFMYLGSEVRGGFQASDDDMFNATWNAYVGFSLNAADANPVFAYTTANDRADPLNRGPCFGRCQPGGGGGMYDFLDIEIHPVTGQVYLALVDNCRDACALPGGTAADQTTGTGAISVQVGGTQLRATTTDAAAGGAKR